MLGHNQAQVASSADVRAVRVFKAYIVELTIRFLGVIREANVDDELTLHA
jgi:hypothetical protein